MEAQNDRKMMVDIEVTNHTEVEALADMEVTPYADTKATAIADMKATTTGDMEVLIRRRLLWIRRSHLYTLMNGFLEGLVIVSCSSDSLIMWH